MAHNFSSLSDHVSCSRTLFVEIFESLANKYVLFTISSLTNSHENGIEINYPSRVVLRQQRYKNILIAKIE